MVVVASGKCLLTRVAGQPIHDVARRDPPHLVPGDLHRELLDREVDGLVVGEVDLGPVGEGTRHRAGGPNLEPHERGVDLIDHEGMRPVVEIGHGSLDGAVLSRETSKVSRLVVG